MDNSPFGKLAPELRNRIYQLAVTCEDPIEVEAVLPNNDPSQAYEWAIRNTRRLALTQSCKAMRADTLQLFYANSDFVLRSHRHWRNFYNFAGTLKSVQAVQGFVKRAGAVNASLARRIIIDAGTLDRHRYGVVHERIHQLHKWIKADDQLRLRLFVAAGFMYGGKYSGRSFGCTTLPLELDIRDLPGSFMALAKDVGERSNEALAGKAIRSIRLPPLASDSEWLHLIEDEDHDTPEVCAQRSLALTEIKASLEEESKAFDGRSEDHFQLPPPLNARQVESCGFCER